ncbi:MAG TPA: LIM domain-containing protein [Gemmatimonadales bacterium]|nr:LIM domain-containing protein [Gemmatimonadales bacterium]
MPDNLQFDHAEPTAAGGAQTAAMSCSVCNTPLSDTYFVANGQIVCERCRRAVEEEWNRGGAAGRLGKAVALGVLAMIACSILWYIVLKLTDSQWGILAVVVGLVVGGAVRKGSHGRGGWRYQALAILLTYTAIVSSYVPLIIESARDQAAQTASLDSTMTTDLAKDSVFLEDSVASAATNTRDSGPLAKVFAIVVLLGFLYALPFLAGIENIIGILIIGFALYEAWKLNRKVELNVTGPHRVAATGAPA